jgi:hypothetical protein
MVITVFLFGTAFCLCLSTVAARLCRYLAERLSFKPLIREMLSPAFLTAAFFFTLVSVALAAPDDAPAAGLSWGALIVSILIALVLGYIVGSFTRDKAYAELKTLYEKGKSKFDELMDAKDREIERLERELENARLAVSETIREGLKDTAAKIPGASAGTDSKE